LANVAICCSLEDRCACCFVQLLQPEQDAVPTELSAACIRICEFSSFTNAWLYVSDQCCDM